MAPGCSVAGLLRSTGANPAPVQSRAPGCLPLLFGPQQMQCRDEGNPGPGTLGRSAAKRSAVAAAVASTAGSPGTLQAGVLLCIHCPATSWLPHPLPAPAPPPAQVPRTHPEAGQPCGQALHSRLQLRHVERDAFQLRQAAQVVQLVAPRALQAARGAGACGARFACCAAPGSRRPREARRTDSSTARGPPPPRCKPIPAMRMSSSHRLMHQHEHVSTSAHAGLHISASRVPHETAHGKACAAAYLLCGLAWHMVQLQRPQPRQRAHQRPQQAVGAAACRGGVRAPSRTVR